MTCNYLNLPSRVKFGTIIINWDLWLPEYEILTLINSLLILDLKEVGLKSLNLTNLLLDHGYLQG